IRATASTPSRIPPTPSSWTGRAGCACYSNPESVVKNSRKTFASCSSLIVAAVLGAACAPKDAANDATRLEAREAWARPADSGAMSAVYFTLGNAGTAADTLVGVASTVAERTEMHISTQHGRTMHMSQVTSLPVPANDSVAFRPLGAHVMLM